MEIARGTKIKLKEETNGRCFFCGCKLVDLITTWDHIIPMSKGGNGTKRNLCALCKGCKSIRRDRSLEEFRNIMKGSREVQYYEFYFESIGLDKYGESYPVEKI